MNGSVSVAGMDTTEAELYETAKVVGSVFQNPRSQFFCVDSTSELAFGPENMGLPEEEIRERIDTTVALMKIRSLMDRSIFEMSGGEKQRIACASVDTLNPEVCVLDEPSSNLSLEAIEDLKNTLLGWKQKGRTIVVAEHRLYWLKDICDRVICLKEGKIIFDMPMKEFRNLSEE
jgi:energy-coupling factor transport system ATP-binding protein